MHPKDDQNAAFRPVSAVQPKNLNTFAMDVSMFI